MSNKKCTICQNSNVLNINSELLKGTNLQALTRQFNVSYHALWRHKKNCLPKYLVKSAEVKQSISNFDILDSLNHLIGQTQAILKTSQLKGSSGTSLNAIKELKSLYQLISDIFIQMQKAREQESFMNRDQIEHELKQAANDDFREKLKILSKEERQIYILLETKIVSQDEKLRPLDTLKMDSDKNQSGSKLIRTKNIDDKPDHSDNIMDDLPTMIDLSRQIPG